VSRFLAFCDRHPVLTISLLVACQQVLTLWSRDLWWSDEVRQADVLRNLLDGHWIALRLNDFPYPDKPPLYFWLQGAVATILGSTEPHAILIGLALTVAFFMLSAYAMARLMDFPPSTGLVAVAIMGTANYLLFLSHYARMDFLFVGFIALAWGCFWRASQDSRWRWMILGFTTASVATMVKGPFGFLLPLGALIAFLVWKREPRRLLSADVVLGLVILMATVLAWIGGIALAEGFDYVRFIFSDQIVSRGVRNATNPFNYLLYLLLLPAVFMPWTTGLATLLLRQRGARPPSDPRDAFLWCTGISGLVILSLVGEKHDYYLLPLFVPLALIAAGALLRASGRDRASSWKAMAATLAIAGLLLPLIPSFLPYAISMPGVLACAALLLAAAVAIFVLRHKPVHAPLGALVVIQMLWVNVLAIAVMPSLDPVMSPRAIAEAVRPYVERGYAPAAWDMTGGDFAYHLRQPYAERFADRQALADWLADRPAAVLATPVAAWDRLDLEAMGLREAARVGMAGDIIVIGLHGMAGELPRAP